MAGLTGYLATLNTLMVGTLPPKVLCRIRTWLQRLKASLYVAISMGASKSKMKRNAKRNKTKWKPHPQIYYIVQAHHSTVFFSCAVGFAPSLVSVSEVRLMFSDSVYSLLWQLSVLLLTVLDSCNLASACWQLTSSLASFQCWTLVSLYMHCANLYFIVGAASVLFISPFHFVSQFTSTPSALPGWRI